MRSRLEFKNRKVLGNLERIGGFSPELLEKIADPIVGMEIPFHYRNKAQFPFGKDKNGVTGDRVLCRPYSRYYCKYRLCTGSRAESGDSGNHPVIYGAISDGAI